MTVSDEQPKPVLEEKSQFELREMLIDMVMRDLLGPAGGPDEEVAESRVRERYLLGMLAPKQISVNQEELDEIAEAGTDSYDEGKTDTGTVHANTFFPSSMGMTFSVSGESEKIKVIARWGRYDRVHSETLVNDKGDPVLVWKRMPVEGVLELDLKEGNIPSRVLIKEQPEIKLKGRTRKHDSGWIMKTKAKR